MLLATLTALTISTFGSIQLQAAQPAPRNPATTAVAQRTATAPVIDGLQNDVVWAHAARTSNFLEFQPKVSTPPRFKTEFQVAFDDRNLYVFVRAFDPHPDSI